MKTRQARLALVLPAVLTLACSTHPDSVGAGTSPKAVEHVGPFVAKAGALAHHVDGAFDATITAQGVSLTGPRFDVGFSLRSFGRRDRLAAVSARSAVADSRGATLAFNGFSEWWRPQGNALEEGITIDQRPAGSGPLVARLALTTALVPELIRGDVVLRDRNGAARVSVRGLHALDAKGRWLPAHLEIEPAAIEYVVDDTDAEYPVVIDPTVGTETTLLPADVAANWAFGSSVALAGNRLVVGASGAIVSSGSDGAAYVFDRDPTTGTWSQSARLVAGDGGTGGLFGYAVALAGDQVIVSADERVVGGYAQVGTAYVFNRDSTGTWSQTQKLLPADLGKDSASYFGYAMAYLNGTLAISAYGAYAGTVSSAGAVYVYTHTGTGPFTQQAKVVAASPIASDYMGTSLALSAVGGTTLLAAGTYYHPGPAGSYQGGAYLFSRAPSATTWSQTQLVLASDGAANDNFGKGIALDGATLAVGADGVSAPVSGGGAVYLFSRNASTGLFAQTDKVVPSDAVTNLGFGATLSMTGGVFVAGAPYASPATHTSVGVAYEFSKSGTTWSPRRLDATDAADYDYYGSAISFDGTRIAVGAPGKLAGGYSSAGQLYVYEPGQALGAKCGRAADCGSGLCVDGVCCDGACTGQCMACNAAGHCAPVDGAPPVGSRTPCAAPYLNCSAGACATDCTAKGDADCASGAHCDATKHCVSNGNDGDPCGRDVECASTHCVDGVCCNDPCTAGCGACNVVGHKGACWPVTGAPVGSRSCGAPVGDPVCGLTCNGTDIKACHPADTSVACVSQTCVGSSVTSAGKCDGSGACSAPPSACPNNLTCGTNGKCKATCVSSGDCVSGSTCGADGKCSPPRTSSCSADHLSEQSGATITPCNAGYACDDGTGHCRTSCAATSDCSNGFTCDLNTRLCVPGAGKTSQSGGCATSNRGGGDAGATWLAAIALACATTWRRSQRRR